MIALSLLLALSQTPATTGGTTDFVAPGTEAIVEDTRPAVSDSPVAMVQDRFRRR